MQNYKKKNKKNSVALPKEVSIIVTRPFTILKKKKKKITQKIKIYTYNGKETLLHLGMRSLRNLPPSRKK